MIYLVLVLATPVLLAVALFIETSSWWIRAEATPGTAGLYVSRSNIYLYGGRFFSLAFTSMLAFWIEHSATPAGLSWQLAISLAFSATFQFALLAPPAMQRAIVRLLTRSLRLPEGSVSQIKQHIIVRPLLISTAASAAIFGLGTGLPLLAAVLVPEYRLSVSYLGQVVNSGGTLIILMLVDQKLFRSLDQGTLAHDVHSYGLGRIAGFLIAAACFAIAALAVAG